VLWSLVASSLSIGFAVRSSVETSEHRSGRPREVLLGATLLLTAAAVHGSAGDGLFDFEAMDENADGLVSKEEYMAQVLHAFGEVGNDEKEVRVGMVDFVSKLFDASDISGDEFLQELEMQYGRLMFYSMTGCSRRRKDCDDEFEFGSQTASTAFEAFDANGDGEVSWEEYLHAVPGRLASCRLGAERRGEHYLPAVAARSFQKADVVQDGALGRKELHFALFLAKGGMISELVWEDMLAMDLNSDANLDSAEVAAARAQPQPGRGTVVALVAQQFGENDADGDGALDSGEMAACARDIHEWIFTDC